MPRKKKKTDEETKQTDETDDENRDRRFMWEPGDVTYTPPGEVEPEQIPPRRRK